MKTRSSGGIRALIFLVLLLAVAPVSYAATAPLQGAWTGTLTVSQATMRVVFHFSSTADGKWTGTLDSPDEGRDWSIDKVTVEQSALHCEINAILATSEGTLASDGQSIAGTWIKMQRAIPLNLKRSPADTAPLADKSSRPAQIEDIAVFRSQFLNADRAYSDTARAQANERLAALERAAGSTTPEAFLLELCAITALADNGHSQCFLPGGAEAQIGFTALGGHFFVTSVSLEHGALLGAELAAIDGHSVSTVRTELRKLHGGLAAWRDLFAVKLLNRPDLLHSLGLTASFKAAVYRVHTSNGRTIEQRLEGTNTSAARAVLPRPEGAPWSLKDPDQPFRFRDAPEVDGVVIQLRQNSDSGDHKIRDFLVDAEAGRVNLGRRNVILDMRQNGGGNFLLTRDLMLGWPKKVGPAGRIFVLEGPETFSAAIASTAYLKQAGGDQVVLVGAPPGDRLTFFAEGHLSTLPHSGIRVLSAPQRDDFADGCRRYTDCFAVLAQPGSATGSPPEDTAIFDWVYGRKAVAVRSLDPDIPAPWTILDYQSGHDPAMEALQRWLTASSPQVE